MSSFMRHSKFRHVYCDAPRQDASWSNFRLSTVTGEQNYIKANTKYFAVGLQGGGGPLGVVNLDKPHRMDTSVPSLVGHHAAVVDFDFNPFDESIIASGSEDTTIKVWRIPEGGLTENITTPLVDMTGHHKKVTHLNFHPTASNIIMSASGDQTVKLWDIEKNYEINSMNEVDQLFHGLAWSYEGDQYAVSSKDHSIRIVDARTATVTTTITAAHEGSKSIRLVYLGSSNQLCSVGFTKQSERQFKIWDPRNTSAHLEKVDLDRAAGVIMPFYDADTSMLYLAGKGDGNVRYFEINNGKVFPLSEFRTSVSQKGMAMVPKRGCDVMHAEVTRMMKLTTNSVEPLSFVVPRKSEGFQDDIFPDTFSGEFSHTSDEWLAGSSKPPCLASLDPNNNTTKTSAPKATFTVAKSPAQLAKELEEANKRIEFLTQRLKEAGLSTD